MLAENRNFCAFSVEDTWLFAFHLFSNNVRIVNQDQTFRQSLERARHELKKKLGVLRLRAIASLTAPLEFLLLMSLRTSAIEGVSPL